MKRKTRHPGQGELFETQGDAAPTADPIEDLRELLRQPAPKAVPRPASHQAPKLSAMVRGDVYKF